MPNIPSMVVKKMEHKSEWKVNYDLANELVQILLSTQLQEADRKQTGSSSGECQTITR